LVLRFLISKFSLSLSLSLVLTERTDRGKEWSEARAECLSEGGRLCQGERDGNNCLLKGKARGEGLAPLALAVAVKLASGLRTWISPWWAALSW
jgi:hypothetical protein